MDWTAQTVQLIESAAAVTAVIVLVGLLLSWLARMVMFLFDGGGYDVD